jgi:hypothetical protein
MELVGKAAVYLVLATASTIYKGYALSLLWAWLIVPTFDVQEISVASAIGIALVISYLTHRFSLKDIKENEEYEFTERLTHAIALSITRPSLALAIGFVVSQWV